MERLMEKTMSGLSEIRDLDILQCRLVFMRRLLFPIHIDLGVLFNLLATQNEQSCNQHDVTS